MEINQDRGISNDGSCDNGDDDDNDFNIVTSTINATKRCSSSSSTSNSASHSGSTSGSSSSSSSSISSKKKGDTLSTSSSGEEEAYIKLMLPLQYGETERLSGYHYSQQLKSNMGKTLKTRIKRLVSTVEYSTVQYSSFYKVL